MSRFFTAQRAGSHPANEAGGMVLDDDGQASGYLTDGVDLYRSLGVITRGSSKLVGLENCRSLDVVLLPIDELRTRGLRAVIPADDATASG